MRESTSSRLEREMRLPRSVSAICWRRVSTSCVALVLGEDVEIIWRGWERRM